MFFILSIIMFVALGAISFSLNGIIHPDAAIGFGCVFCGLGVVFFIAGVFINFTKYDEIIRQIGRLKRRKAELCNKQLAYDNMKAEFVNHMSKQYPEFEKELFKNIAPTDAEQLKMYAVKYPEITSNMVLSKLVDKVCDWEKNLIDAKKEILYCYEEIEFILNNKWLVIHPNIPEDILNAIKKL